MSRPLTSAAGPSHPDGRIIGEVGPDGIPIGDPGVSPPALTLGRREGNQLDRLEDLLENANSYSGDRE